MEQYYYCTTLMEKSKIQMLYDACNTIFSQNKQLPTFQEIQCLKKLTDEFEGIDVGIDEFGWYGSRPTWSPRGLICGRDISGITYIHIHECEAFSIGVFCMPAGATFPLHDHPGMTVFSKLLYGSIHVKAYDWINAHKSPASQTFGIAAKVVDGMWRAPCETSVLFPTSGGNIHSFTALTSSAVLDVLSPPYSEDLGRPSSYFFDFTIPSLPGYVMLEERELPDDLVVTGAPYLGPPLHIRC
ncbi:hypothetical protein FNV43_RR11074 [Rhamnella rubrinervis]|uniref:cysteine dioxygenase n=1 Tax=Rhamnella rubrinervis TaxID=2594499 RepID=A0A8K0MHE1_9ROSA|nr:hypothetical protein FNV43_RR11074 [Rhamnella rubrinervis]